MRDIASRRTHTRTLRLMAIVVLALGILPAPLLPVAASDGPSLAAFDGAARAGSLSGGLLANRAAGSESDLLDGGHASPALNTEPVIEAVKTDSLLVDNDGDGDADPGDTIRYVVVISNSGSVAATGVIFSDTIDAHTALSGTVSPLALDDTYTATGNVQIVIASDGLLENDVDPDGGPLVVSAFQHPSDNGGDVSVDVTGVFTYNPAPGFEGIDTFAYTIEDPDGKTDSATVSILVADMIWFVDAAAAAGGDGRLTAPYDCLTGAGCFDPAAPDDPGDNIFLADGAYTGGLVLLDNQRLIGDGSSSDLATLTGITLPPGSLALPTFSGTDPIITTSGAVNGINLGAGNTVRGLTVDETPGGFGISATAAGPFNILESSVTGTGGALSIGASGTAGTVSFDALSSDAAPGAGINLVGVTGSVLVASGAITDPSGTAVRVSGGSVTLAYPGSVIKNSAGRVVDIDGTTGGTLGFGAAVSADHSGSTGIRIANSAGTVSFAGAVDLGSMSNRLTSDGVTLSTNTGTMTFSDVGIFTNNARGFVASDGGTVNVVTGTVNSTNAAAVDVSASTALNITFESVDADGGATGISIDNSTGSFSITGDGATAGSGGTIQNTSDAVRLSSTENVSLSFMDLDSSSDNGLDLITVTMVTLDNVTIDDTGNDGIIGVGVTDLSLFDTTLMNTGDNNAIDHALDFAGAGELGGSNLLGALTLDNVTIDTFTGHGLLLENDSGSAEINVSRSTIISGNVLGENGLTVIADTAADITLNVYTTTFNGVRGESIRATSQAAGASVTVDVRESQFKNGISGGGVAVVADSGGTADFNILENEFFSNFGDPLTLRAQENSTLRGNVIDNAIDDTVGDGMFIQGDGDSQAYLVRVKVDGNTFTDIGDDAVVLSARDGAGVFDITVTSNAVGSAALAAADHGLEIRAREANSTMNLTLDGNTIFSADAPMDIDAEDSTTVNATVTGNTMERTAAGDELEADSEDTDPSTFCLDVSGNALDSGAGGILLDEAPSAVLNIVQASAAAVATANAIPSGSVTVAGSPNFGATASCPAPTLPPAPPAPPLTSLANGEGLAVRETLEGLASAGSVLALQLDAAPSVAAAGGRSRRLVDVTSVVRSSQPAVEAVSETPAASPSALADFENPDVVVDVGTLSAGERITITFDVVVDTPLPAGVEEVCNQGIVTGDNFVDTLTDDPDAGGASDPTCTLVDAAPDMQIEKDDGGVTASPDGTITYTLTYTNGGDQGATGVVLTETVPANTTFNVAASTPGWVCAPDNSAGSTCELVIGALAGGGAGGQAEFAVEVDNPVRAGVTQVDNTAEIGDDGSNGADPNPGDNSDGDSTPVNAAPDMQITKDDGDVTPSPGDLITYTLTYTNAGNQNATGVVLTETVPNSTTFSAGASTPGWACAPDDSAGSTCELVIGALAGGGGGGQADFAVEVDDPVGEGITQIDNTAEIGDDGTNGTDPNPGDNTGSDSTPITRPDLQISKDDGGVTASPGDTITYTLTYTNAGNQGATGVVLTETVPANTTFNVAASTPGWVCAPDNSAGSTCELVVGAVAGGGSWGQAEFAVEVDNPVGAGVTQIDNTAEIDDDGSSGADPNPGDNSDGDSTPVVAAPDMQILKNDFDVTVSPGDVVFYTLIITNTGDQNATGVALTETVPVSTTFNAGSSSAGWFCLDGDPAGTTCTYDLSAAIGSEFDGGENLVVLATFAVMVDDPVGAGVAQIENTAKVGDDGTNGIDPNPGDNTGSDGTPVDAAPDMQITKDDGGGMIYSGDTIAYTIIYTNAGNQGATGVVLTETVPNSTTFNAGVSTPGWACAPDNSAGSVCELVVGTVPGGGDSSQVEFAADVDASYASRGVQIDNSVEIGDDGGNGADPNPGDNTDSLATKVEAPIIYLPLILRSFVVAPDLAVKQVIATTNDLQVVIENRGRAPVKQAFWVDAYIDPNPVPTAVNETWPFLADEGAVWGVTVTLHVGEVMTLTVGDAHYDDQLSSISWPLLAGVPVYAQVDSANTGTTFGAVLETHEILGGPYANNLGSQVVTLAASAAARGVAGARVAGRGAERSNSLPLRPPGR